MPHIGNSNGENDDCPSNLGVPYLPHKATFMHLSCVFFDSTSRLVWVMNHFAPKSHLQPSNNSWSWKFVQLKLGFQMFPVSSGYPTGNLSRVRSPATHHCCLVLWKPRKWQSLNHVLFGMTWLLSSSKYPLVNVYITMENHHFYWENSL